MKSEKQIEQIPANEIDRRKILLELSTVLYAELAKVTSEDAARQYVQENQDRIETMLMLVVLELTELFANVLRKMLDDKAVKATTALQAIAQSPTFTDLVAGLDRTGNQNWIASVLNQMGPQTDYANLMRDAARASGALQTAVTNVLAPTIPSIRQHCSLSTWA